jgi:hypothetical protein
MTRPRALPAFGGLGTKEKISMLTIPYLFIKLRDHSVKWFNPNKDAY